MIRLEKGMYLNAPHLLQVGPDEKIMQFHNNKGWPFIACDNMIYKSILDYYHINELAGFIEDGFAYEFIENAERIAFRYTVIPFDLSNSPANREALGLKWSAYKTEEEYPLKLIKEGIDRGHPLACALDIYHLEGRDGYYHKEHGGHFVLITGYYDERAVFYLIDNTDGYAIYECSYKEMEFYIEQTKFMKDGQSFKFLWEISYEKKCDTYDPAWIENVVNEYKGQLDFIKARWIQNTKEIDILIKRLDDLILQEQFKTNIESLIYRMSSELYILINMEQYGLYEEEKYKRLCDLKRKVIENWKKIRKMIIYKEIRGDKRTEDMIGPIVEIRDMENEILSLRL